jgi:hypothetical protein
MRFTSLGGVVNGSYYYCWSDDNRRGRSRQSVEDTQIVKGSQRSMASDKQQVDRMERHRERLLAEGKLSVPPHAGRTAIITMYDSANLVKAKIRANRLGAMDREARRIRSYLRWRGMDAVYLPEVTIDEFWEVLDDIHVSDMVLIGIAQLSRVNITPWTREPDAGKRHDMVGFFDAISRDGTRPTITHLKRGDFYQRTSGEMHKGVLNIPFAWGFMADRSRIWAAPQVCFRPNQWHARPQTGLVNVAAYLGLTQQDLQQPMSYSRAKEVFGARESLTRRYPVPRFAYPAYDRLRENQKLQKLHDEVRRKLEAIGLTRF